jgi:hypothetical protein
MAIVAVNLRETIFHSGSQMEPPNAKRLLAELADRYEVA